MKICDIIETFNGKSGGIRTYLDQKREYIRNHPTYEHVIIIPGPCDEIIQEENLKIYRIKSPLIPGSHPYRMLYRLNKVYSILKEEKPDLIELGSLYLVPWLVFLYRLFHKSKIVAYYHTDFPSAYVFPFASKYLGKIIGQALQKISSIYSSIILNSCDATVTGANLLKDKLNTMGVKRIHSIPLGVDLQFFHPDKRSIELRKVFNASKNDKVLIYAGRFDSEKRVDLIVQAFQKIQDSNNIRLILVGDGPLRTVLHNMVGENSNIYIWPYQTDKVKLAQLLASSDVYLTAGPHETFALSVVEAQASGLAVIGVNAGALIERINEKVGLLAEPDNVLDFSQKIEFIVKKDYRQMGLEARKMVEHNYSWEKTWHKLFTLYHQIFHEKEYLQTNFKIAPIPVHSQTISLRKNQNR